MGWMWSPGAQHTLSIPTHSFIHSASLSECLECLTRFGSGARRAQFLASRAASGRRGRQEDIDTV